MIKVNVCKAEPLGNFQKVESGFIFINNKIPTRLTLVESEAFHEKQANMINKVLYETLPQGTYDLLGIKFMQRKVSMYQGRTGT